VYSVESPIRSRRSIGSECDPEKEQESEVKATQRKSKQKRLIEKKKRKGSREAE
jgi:hypothetical protein